MGSYDKHEDSRYYNPTQINAFNTMSLHILGNVTCIPVSHGCFFFVGARAFCP